MAEPDKTRIDDDTLEDFFAAARAAPVAVSDDLVARILQDAAAAQPWAPAPARAAPGPLARLVGALGGWPSLAGLAAAALAGVWIGTAQPVMIEDLGIGLSARSDTAAAEGYDLADLMPGYDILAGGS
ncbi:dihydroorotate dehydrogenase [Oceaniglobus roseus]|uniref:dihydroorotate dehydrogenase n=1 Tax=Oceaniglobus roseus TaxID=1737570 RepID=UPI000C7EE40B|nr:dihydroorotate dehydrogenase [Kandeliimicrobium roseum]